MLIRVHTRYRLKSRLNSVSCPASATVVTKIVTPLFLSSRNRYSRNGSIIIAYRVRSVGPHPAHSTHRAQTDR